MCDRTLPTNAVFVFDDGIEVPGERAETDAMLRPQARYTRNVFVGSTPVGRIGMAMNKIIPALLLMGLMLVFPVIAFAQQQAPNIIAADLSVPSVMDADEAIEIQWIQDEKEIVEEIIARASKVFLNSDRLTGQFRGFEVTPIVSSDLYGINLSYKW